MLLDNFLQSDSLNFRSRSGCELSADSAVEAALAKLAGSGPQADQRELPDRYLSLLLPLA
jgi:hypothetical protein